MSKEWSKHLNGELLNDDAVLGLRELCRLCGLEVDQVEALVAEGVAEPLTGRTGWHFRAVSVARVRRAAALHRDLGLNWAGAALAIELLEELEQLRARLQQAD